MFCTGKSVGPLQLFSILGSFTRLQSVFGASCVWYGTGDHAHWSAHLLHWSAMEEQTTMDLQSFGCVTEVLAALHFIGVSFCFTSANMHVFQSE